MFFRKSNELEVPPVVTASKDSHEVLRAWVVDGSQVVTLNATAFENPFSWGIFLADITRHLSNAIGGDDEKERLLVLDQVIAGIAAELENPTDEPKEVREH